MKTVRYSKIKILYDLIRDLISSAIILLTLHYFFFPEFFKQRIDFIVISILLFAVLMMLVSVFFIFTTPTMISIIFNSDHLIFKYVKGYGEKKVLYRDMKWIKKAGFFGNRFAIEMHDENIPLTLTLFNKFDRSDIVETIKNRVMT